jgi:hypothetical protein
MADWTHKYREEMIPPQGTITRDTPGKRIAKAVTEIQERAVIEASLQLSGGLTGDAEVRENTLVISIEAPPPGSTFPEGGEPDMVLTRTSSGYAWDWVRAVDV